MNNITQQKQSYMGPFITMVVLMALVGLITNINQQFQAPMQDAFLKETGDLKNTFATMINFTFFLAYLVMGNISAGTIDKRGYRGALIVGLVILLGGFGLFEASAWQYETYGTMYDITEGVRLPLAYFIFILGSFVAGTALTFLQAAVNPYVVACDVKGTTGVQRQSIAGAANSSMTTVGPLIVAYIIFGGKTEGIEVGQLYIPIFVLIVIVAILATVLKRLNLPDIPGTAAGEDNQPTGSVWKFRHLALGVIAIFFYVGVEVAVGANINLYATSVGESMTVAAKMASLYWGGMLVGRLCGSFVNNVSAQRQLLVTSIGATALIIATILTNNPWCLVGVGLFHSIMWPAIFALAIDGLGVYTSKGSGALMMGVFGGAVLPLVQGMTADAVGSWQYTWLIVVAAELYLLFYAVNGYKVIKK